MLHKAEEWKMIGHAPKIKMMKEHRRHLRLDYRALRSTYFSLRPLSFFRNSGPQPLLDQAEDPSVGNAVLDKHQHPFV